MIIQIIVEGKNDIFFFNKLLNRDVCVDGEGKTNILDEQKLRIRYRKCDKILIIVDADYTETGANLSGYETTKQKCEELKKQFGSLFEYVIISPSDNQDGELESLAIDVLKHKDFKFECCYDNFMTMMDCELQAKPNCSNTKKAILTCYKRFYNAKIDDTKNDFFGNEDLVEKLINLNQRCGEIKTQIETKLNLLNNA